MVSVKMLSKKININGIANIKNKKDPEKFPPKYISIADPTTR